MFLPAGFLAGKETRSAQQTRSSERQANQQFLAGAEKAVQITSFGNRRISADTFAGNSVSRN